MADVRISDATTATTGTVYVPGGAGGAPLKVPTTGFGRSLMAAGDADAASELLGLADVATSGDYDDLANRPTLGTAAAAAAADFAAAVPADRRPIIPDGLAADPVFAYRAGHGSATYLADTTGNTMGLSLASGTAPTLVVGDAPGGGDAMVMAADTVFAATLAGVDRHGLVVILTTQPTADGTLFEDDNGGSAGYRITIAAAGTNMRAGQLGGEAEGFGAMRQYSVFVCWYSSNSSNGVYAICNGRVASVANPGSATNVPGIKIKGAQKFVSLVGLRLRTTTDLPGYPELYRLFKAFYPLTLPTGSQSWAVLGDSNSAGVSGMAHGSTFVGQLEAGLSAGWKVGCAAVPGMDDVMLARLAPAQVDGLHPAVCSITSLTNTLAFASGYVADANATQTLFLNQLRARCAASPGTLFVVSDCPPRADLGGDQAAYDAAKTTINGTSGLRASGLFDTLATGNSGIGRPGASLPSNCRLARVSTLNITRTDTVHPNAAGNTLQAALFIACAADYGIEV